MNENKMSVADFIALWARNTQVSQRFVDSVIQLFESKGISLQGECGPYEDAVKRAFTSRSEMEKTCAALNSSLGELREGMSALQTQCQRLVSRSQELEQRMSKLRAVWDKAATMRKPAAVPAPVVAAEKPREEKPREEKPREEKDSSPSKLWMLRPNLLVN